MPEGGEGALIVVPGGSEVGTSTVGGVQTPSRLGGGGSRDGQDTHTSTSKQTNRHTNGTQEGNGTNVVRRKGIEICVNMSHTQGTF